LALFESMLALMLFAVVLLQVARQTALPYPVFHELEQELDWKELAASRKPASTWSKADRQQQPYSACAGTSAAVGSTGAFRPGNTDRSVT
jgi:hypothetical protein